MSEKVTHISDDFTLHIESADNGFVLRQGARVEVVEEADFGDDAEARTSLALLYRVLDMLGRLGSKHDAYRVRVVVMDQQQDTPVEDD